jgi:hypothetical protein
MMAVRLFVFMMAVVGVINADSLKEFYRQTLAEVTLHKTPNRKPAAVPSSKMVSDDLEKQALIELNCSRKLANEMKVNSPWAQIKGRFCKPSKSQIVEITNESNGFTASIFNLNSEEYKTDLIQLKNGPNKIRIRVQSTDGLLEEQTVLVESSHI